MHLADAAHAVAASIAVVTLVGWIWGRPLLASWGPSFVPMKPITALAVLALAAALTRRLPLSQGARGGLCGLAVLLGLSSLLQDLAGIDLRLPFL